MLLPPPSIHNLPWSTHGPIADGMRGTRACRLAEAPFTAGALRRLASSPDLRFCPVSANRNWLDCANQTSLCVRRLARRSLAAGLLAVFALYISAPSANAELIFDKAGNAYTEDVCPWSTPDLPGVNSVLGCPICPIPYFPCWQEGYFCFRPIYCQGKFSPEGFGNAAIILGGIFGPLYKLYSTKKFEALLNQNPQSPEAIAYYNRRKEIQDRSFFF